MDKYFGNFQTSDLFLAENVIVTWGLKIVPINTRRGAYSRATLFFFRLKGRGAMNGNSEGGPIYKTTWTMNC